MSDSKNQVPAESAVQSAASEQPKLGFKEQIFECTFNNKHEKRTLYRISRIGRTAHVFWQCACCGTAGVTVVDEYDTLLEEVVPPQSTRVNEELMKHYIF
jgi:hypothetical protein